MLGQKRICFLVFLLAAICAGLLLSGPAGATTSCASRLLADWQDGRIDMTYPVSCYRQALAHLPEDVRVYSSAQNDITRALQARLGAPSARATASHSGGDSGISPLAVLGITGGLLLLAGGSLAVVRR
jgi:hypothetical protein